MFKELLLAIVLGALLGFGLTGGIIAIKKNKTTINNLPPASAISTTPTAISTVPHPSETSLNTNNHQIAIESPENESIVTNSKISIKGSTSPQSTLVITTSGKSYFGTADIAGNFTVDIEIESGVNLIQIDALDLQDNQATTKLIVTYSTTII